MIQGTLPEAYEIDSDNQLCLTPAGALDLSRRVTPPELLAEGRALGRRGTSGGRIALDLLLLLAEARGTAHRGRSLTHGVHVGRVADGGAGVDRGWSSYHLAGRGAVLVDVRAGAANGSLAGREVGRVAGRAVARTRVIHWEAGSRRGGTDGGRGSVVRLLRLLRLLLRREALLVK